MPPGSSITIPLHVFTEQRTSERKVLRTRARVVMEGAAPASGRTSDLGANGVSINLPEPLVVGQTGQVSFDLMVEGKLVPVSARAKALYCIFSSGEFKVGFQFLNLELAAMTAVARFLR
ncbi:PilZ domain-containing protein [Massilia oculi]|uniref:PilZ domain-containing protein n=1 Tax=Massilia hydrophila TaxID=3044279 RepID=A0ABS7YBH5_9BURK|nr:PilZ domain-containing protein [Massilia oculi]MCA1856452.1 PilZ domain-containing protein [Massilia oculi]